MPSSTYVATQPGPFAALLQAAELGGLPLDPLPPVRVRDVYLDTDTGALLGHGYALRARTLDGDTTLGLRALSGEGPSLEAGGSDDLTDLPPGPLADTVGHLTAGAPLGPILSLRQYRTPRIAYDRARLIGLVSFDVVVYELSDGHLVANEVELELGVESRPEDAERIDAVLREHGLEPAGRSKMERGLLRARRGLDEAVLLVPAEREALEVLRDRGTVEERRRAHILLLDARGFGAQTIAEQAGTSLARVERVRADFRSARMDAVRSGSEFAPPSTIPPATPASTPSPNAPDAKHLSVAEFEDLDALLDAFQTTPTETPSLGGPPVSDLDPVPLFVPDVGWERSAALSEPPRPDAEDADADWLEAPRFEPVGEALVAETRSLPGAPSPPVSADDATAPATPEAPGGVPGFASWIDAAVAPADQAADVAGPLPRSSWIDAAVAPPRTSAPSGALAPSMWARADVIDGVLAGAAASEEEDPFGDAARLPRRARHVDRDTPILEAAWLTIGHQVGAFEAATDALFHTSGAREARKLFLSAHRVRLALESFAPYLPDRAVERMTGALRRLVLTLDAALDYDRASAEAPQLASTRDAHLATARTLLEGGRQRAWGHRSRRLLGRLQAQGREGLLIGDDFPAPPDDFIGEVGDRPVPSRLKHVLGSLVWRRYEDVLAFEDDMDGEVSAELAYHLATAISGLHFVLGLAETATPEAARDLARILDQAEALAAAYRHERRTAELTAETLPFRHDADEVREVWRLLASPAFRQRLAVVAVGA